MQSTVIAGCKDVVGNTFTEFGGRQTNCRFVRHFAHRLASSDLLSSWGTGQARSGWPLVGGLSDGPVGEASVPVEDGMGAVVILVDGDGGFDVVGPAGLSAGSCGPARPLDPRGLPAAAQKGALSRAGRSRGVSKSVMKHLGLSPDAGGRVR